MTCFPLFPSLSLMEAQLVRKAAVGVHIPILLDCSLEQGVYFSRKSQPILRNCQPPPSYCCIHRKKVFPCAFPSTLTCFEGNLPATVRLFMLKSVESLAASLCLKFTFCLVCFKRFSYLAISLNLNFFSEKNHLL